MTAKDSADQGQQMWQAPAGAGQMLQEARQTVPEVTAAQTKEALDRGEVAVLLDVREPNEWEQGHIPGAVHAPRGMLEWYADETTSYAKPELTANKNERIVVACAGGGRSLLAAQTLQRMGYTNVASMAGGFNDWAKQGFPVESAGTEASAESPSSDTKKG